MALAYAILRILRDGPRHGYAIRNQLHQRLGLLWPVNHGQVYSTLARLTSQGLVAVVDPPPRPIGPEGRHYLLTEAGERRLLDWLRRPASLKPRREEVLVKIALCADRGDPHCLERLLDRQRTVCTALAETFRSELALAAGGGEGIATVTQRAALSSIEADLDWLDAVAGVLGIERPKDSCPPQANPHDGAAVEARPGTDSRR